MVHIIMFIIVLMHSVQLQHSDKIESLIDKDVLVMGFEWFSNSFR